MKALRFSFLLICLLGLFAGCEEKANKKTQPEVKAAPPKVETVAPQPTATENGARVMVTPLLQTPCQKGDLSGANLEPLRVIFIGLPFEEEHIGKVLSSGVSITPNNHGTWRWSNSNELSYTPDTDWISGVNYRVKLSPSILPAKTSLAPASKNCDDDSATNVSTPDEYCFRVYAQCFDTNSLRLPFSMVLPQLPTTATDVAPSQFVLNFENAVGLSGQTDKPLLAGVELTPLLGGAWRWQNERTLTFSPAEPWPQDTKFDLTLSDAAFAPNAIIPGYKYSFRTPISSIKKARLQSTLTVPEAPAKEKDPKPSLLKLTFQDAVAGASLISAPLKSGVTLMPAVEGKWSWTTDRELVFTPAAHWPASQSYELAVTGEAFGDKAESFGANFNFKSAAIVINLTNASLYVDPQNPRTKRVVATAELNYPLNRSELEKALSLQLREKNNPAAASYSEFKVTYDELGRTAYIHSEPLAIPKEDSVMKIQVSAGVHSALPIAGTSKLAQSEVYVPGVESYFRISDASFQNIENRQRGEDQVLLITATAGLTGRIKDTVTAYLLPQYFPGTEGNAEVYSWSKIAEITPEIIEASEKVNLELLPFESEYSTVASFRFQAQSNRYMFVRVGSGTKTVDNYSLAKDYLQTVYVGAPNKTIKILASGALLSMSGEKKVSVMVRDVEKMDIEIARVLPGSLLHLVSQTGGNFQNPYFVNYSFGADDLAERIVQTRQFALEEAGKPQYTTLDFASLLNSKTRLPRGLFLVKLSENLSSDNSQVEEEEGDTGAEEEVADEGEGEYSGEENPAVFDFRLVLVTDLGVVVKKNRLGTQDVFVQDLATGAPAGGATVRVLGRNGLAIFEKKLGADGHVTLPDLSSFVRDREPRAYVAERGDDIAFMPYACDDRQVNLSRFDVGGLQSNADALGIQGFVFSDRGVYRPGEEIHFGLVVKPDDWKGNYKDVPLKAVITDPRGVKVRQETIKLSAEGFSELSFRPDESSLTGSYQLGLYVEKDKKRGSLLGSANVRVEEFLPDRMRISVALSAAKQKGWIKPEQLSALVNLQNLFGTPAQDRKVKARMQLQPSNLVFSELPGFSFSDPLRAQESFEEELEEKQSDKNGETKFDLNLERFLKATYRLNVLASGFEAEGGRSVSAVSSNIVSPLEAIVGFKTLGDLRYVAKGSSSQAQLIAVNSDLQRVELKNLKAEFVESRWLSVLTKQPNETYAYQSQRKDVPVSAKDLEITSAGINLDLDTSKPGDFALIIRDSEGTELNRIAYSVVGAGNLSPNLEANAELDIRLNRSDFAPGEEIEVSIRSPYAGAGLISIEKDKVYGFTWFRSTERSSVQKIKVPEGLEGNGYVNVTFVRALDSKDIYLSPLSYGVAPFSIDKERRRAKLALKAPAELKPGAALEVKYSGTAGKAAIFLVDEGILQYARYQTPDPLSYFFRKRALEVNTSQILDLLMPEYSIERALSAAGGDEDLLRKHLNPFKRRRLAPVAVWSGIVDVSPEEKTFSYTVPEYFNGSIRVMAVAISADAVGSTERQVAVRGDFVVTPNVPAAVAPGDEFSVSATVSNGAPKGQAAAKTTVSITPSAGLEIVGEAKFERDILPGEESSVVFRLKAKAELGAQSLRFTASSASGASGISEEISVRPAAPLVSSLQAGFAELSAQNNSAEAKINRRSVYPFAEKFEASASTLPLGFAHGLSQYLMDYPYGCTEQLVSAMMSQLVLLDQPAFGLADRKKVEKALNSTLGTLRSRQGRDGGISLWYAGGYVENAVHLWATLFLLEAKERSFTVPGDMLKDALRYAEGIASASSLVGADAAFASYLLARSGKAVNIALIPLRSFLESAEGKAQGDWIRERTGMFLAATYKLMQDDNEAKTIFNKATLLMPREYRYDDYYDSFIHGSIYLYLAAKYFPDELRGFAPSTIQRYLKPLIGANNYNTHSAAWAVLGLDAYMRREAEGEKAAFSVAALDGAGAVTELGLNDALFPTFKLPPSAATLRFSSERPVYYQIYQQGYDKEPAKEAISNGLEVSRQLLNSEGKETSSAGLGEKLTVVLRVRALGEAPVKNVVLVDMLPGGSEVVMSSSRFSQTARDGQWGFALAESTFAPDYADIREDRVQLFGTIPNDKVVEFRYQLNTTNRGAFIVPPVYAESMYDKSITAVGLGGVLRVEDEAR